MDLGSLAILVEKWTGLEITRGGSDVRLREFVAGRVRDLRLDGPDAYIALLQADPTSRELARLVSAITVGHTWFFRDPPLLAALEHALRASPTGRPVYVWVAGCSTGEDAYTLRMLGMRAGRDVRVTGSDINPRCIDRAREARYNAWSVRAVPDDYKHHFTSHGDGFSLVSEAKSHVQFVVHNLMTPPLVPATRPHWDVILCRNVLIYFSHDRAAETVDRFTHVLARGGWLALGSSRILPSTHQDLKVTQHGSRVIYRRREVAMAAEDTPAEPWQSAAAKVKPRINAILDLPDKPVDYEKAVIPESPWDIDTEIRHDTFSIVTKGNRELEAGHMIEAVASYALALQRDPLCAEARMFAGIAYFLSEDPERAIDSLRSALFLDSSLWPARYYLAKAHEALGHSREARREYSRLTKLAPGSAELRLNSRSALLDDLHQLRHEVLRIARSHV